MEQQEDAPYGVLANILVSKKVGLDHIRLVGELIVVQARLNASPGPVSADVIERVAVSEGTYKAAWKELAQNSDPALRVRKLEDLARSLSETILLFDDLCKELRGPEGA